MRQRVIEVGVYQRLKGDEWALTARGKITFGILDLREEGGPRMENEIPEEVAIHALVNFMLTSYKDARTRGGEDFDPANTAASAHFQGLGEVYVTATGERLGKQARDKPELS